MACCNNNANGMLCGCGAGVSLTSNPVPTWTSTTANPQQWITGTATVPYPHNSPTYGANGGVIGPYPYSYSSINLNKSNIPVPQFNPLRKFNFKLELLNVNPVIGEKFQLSILNIYLERNKKKITIDIQLYEDNFIDWFKVFTSNKVKDYQLILSYLSSKGEVVHSITLEKLKLIGDDIDFDYGSNRNQLDVLNQCIELEFEEQELCPSTNFS